MITLQNLFSSYDEPFVQADYSDKYGYGEDSLNPDWPLEENLAHSAGEIIIQSETFARPVH